MVSEEDRASCIAAYQFVQGVIYTNAIVYWPEKKIMSTGSTFNNFPYHDLPFDILSNILARLPVINLLKFCSVCRSWCTYIYSPYFISKHRDLYNKEHSKNSHLLIAVTSGRFCLQGVTNAQKLTTRVFLHPFPADLIIPCIYGNCNGLFLLIFHGHQDYICLWNPFLRKSLILPPCPIVSPIQYVNYVIGFSPSSDDYKVLAYRLRTIFNGDEYEAAMAVYSLTNHIWTIKINPMNVDAWASLRDPFSCDNYVYCGWLLYHRPAYGLWESMIESTHGGCGVQNLGFKNCLIYKPQIKSIENGDPGFVFVGAYAETLALLTGTEEMIFIPLP
ncbi:F-box/kelch-repeat protein At3g23880-like [Amaranthus tricolor]|uniref:F-box/kelch-repeat protein At3g23880-like n=1 Tax=Amaranthus tricolor TaxID=29722 RepID=UPI002587F55C|nr:F-box/kelch-repeat protein At3g23880-like [Amaranthus tricolor]XP_057543486.1 F-box/kelch-repeat protein At3g23880-like [Amaranthus tricolor]